MSGPSLADDSFVDKAIATASYCLWALQGGEYTNAVQLLVRPVDIRSDESGGHPGETFVMLTITREEVRAILDELNRDWDQFAAFAGSLD